LLAIEAEFLRKIEAPASDSMAGSDPYGILLRAFALGEEPVHVRELIHARRGRPDWRGVAEYRQRALMQFLGERGLDQALSVVPNPLPGGAAMWKLMARKPLPNVKVLDAWGTQTNIAGLAAAASAPGIEWLAILSSPNDPRALLELSAVGWLDPRVAVVGGLLTDQDGDIVRWSGGLFLPGGRLFDPYAGKAFFKGDRYGQLWCQRCIDVAAPVNVLIRAEALLQAAARIPESAGSDGLMVMLGLLAHEAGDFIAVTPHLRDVLPPASLVMPPLDRDGLVLGAATLERGGRWYDGRLSLDPIYGLWDLA
jgi:hypothetical protein